jgi:hypothetical protein
MLLYGIRIQFLLGSKKYLQGFWDGSNARPICFLICWVVLRKKGQTRRELVTSESKNRYFNTKKQRIGGRNSRCSELDMGDRRKGTRKTELGRKGRGDGKEGRKEEQTETRGKKGRWERMRRRKGGKKGRWERKGGRGGKRGGGEGYSEWPHWEIRAEKLNLVAKFWPEEFAYELEGARRI